MLCMNSAVNVLWLKSSESSKPPSSTSPRLSSEPVAEKFSMPLVLLLPI